MIGTFIDLGFGVIILVAVIVGLSVGFSRQFSRPLVGLIAIFSAIGLTAVIYALIEPLGFYKGLEDKATALFTADFYLQEATDAESLSTILAGGYLRLLATSAEMIWGNMAAMEVVTLGSYFGKLLIKVAAQFLIWLVLYLAIKYLLFGIKFLMTKISRVVVFKSIDKIFGLIWSLGLTYLIVVSIIMTVGELVVVQFFPDIATIATDYMAQTSMVKFLHNTNMVGSFISSMLNWSLFPNM